jgi:intracellular multiplication protein IcmK
LLSGTCSSVFAQEGSNLLLPPPTYKASEGNNIAPQQVQMGGTAPDASQKKDVPQGSTEDPSFKAALHSISPLSPDQIGKTRTTLDAADRAQNAPLSPIQPVTRSIRLSMKPGEMPPTIKVKPGWVSSITFSDVTGQPWPVMSVTRGNPDAYEVLSSGKPGSTNIITISTKQPYISSNIAVTLIGAPVPLMISLDPSGSDVDFRVDAQVDGRGPNATFDMGTGQGLAPTNDSAMLAFLDGVPPDGAKKLRVGDSEVQAWKFNDMLYIRTSRTMLSPAYVSKQSNVSGTNVYVLNEAPVLLLSDSGRMFSVQVQR